METLPKGGRKNAPSNKLIQQNQAKANRRAGPWQKLIIIFTLIFLGFSALPNFYIDDKSSMPNWLKTLEAEPIKLGLDLNGGVLLVLNVDLEHSIKERIDYIENNLKKTAREKKLRDIRISKLQDNRLAIIGKTSESLNEVEHFLRTDFPELSFTQFDDNRAQVEFTPTDLLKLKNEVMQQVLTTMRNRIESLGITESVVQRQGEKRIRIELPGVKNSDEARKVIGSTATLDFYEPSSRFGKSINAPDGTTIYLKSTPIFTGENVKNAVPGRDEMGIPQVTLFLDEAGGQKVLKHSSANIGNQMVTVYSEFSTDERGENKKTSKVISVATIQSVLGNRFSITNLDSPEAANDLAIQIRAGALSAPVNIVKEQTIDATLGKNNIENGIMALMLGLGITLSFMALWYRKLGLVANAALVLNLVSLLGLMSLLPGAVLTLPGIAGLVLTVGMAVDANVIIFERIREELRKNKPRYLAVQQGYQNAWSSILDANITTLVTAVILYSIGFGPVKGFAITLGLGVLTSLFTGVYLSRFLSEWWYVSRHSSVKSLTSQEQK